MQADEELVDARVDQTLGKARIRELAAVGLQAKMIEPARAARIVDVVKELFLERDFTAGERDAAVAWSLAVVVDGALEGFERHAVEVVHPLLHDAEAARAVAVEVHRDGEIFEAR